MKVEYIDSMTKSSYLASTLSRQKNVEASGYTCCYQAYARINIFKQNFQKSYLPKHLQMAGSGS